MIAFLASHLPTFRGYTHVLIELLDTRDPSGVLGERVRCTIDDIIRDRMLFDQDLRDRIVAYHRRVLQIAFQVRTRSSRARPEVDARAFAQMIDLSVLERELRSIRIGYASAESDAEDAGPVTSTAE